MRLRPLHEIRFVRRVLLLELRLLCLLLVRCDVDFLVEHFLGGLEAHSVGGVAGEQLQRRRRVVVRAALQVRVGVRGWRRQQRRRARAQARRGRRPVRRGLHAFQGPPRRGRGARRLLTHQRLVATLQQETCAQRPPRHPSIHHRHVFTIFRVVIISGVQTNIWVSYKQRTSRFSINLYR